MRSWLPYTAARVGLFLVAFSVVYLFGARSWVAFILAWLISGMASYVLLSSLRDRMSAAVVDRIEQRRGSLVSDRIDSGAAREDHLQEAAEERDFDDRAEPERTAEDSAAEDGPGEASQAPAASKDA